MSSNSLSGSRLISIYTVTTQEKRTAGFREKMIYVRKELL